jgi:hypothetical protein
MAGTAKALAVDLMISSRAAKTVRLGFCNR